jgi:hypothetical protein
MVQTTVFLKGVSLKKNEWLVLTTKSHVLAMYKEVMKTRILFTHTKTPKVYFRVRFKVITAVKMSSGLR